MERTSYEWWIVQDAMFDCQRVSIMPVLVLGLYSGLSLYPYYYIPLYIMIYCAHVIIHSLVKSLVLMVKP